MNMPWGFQWHSNNCAELNKGICCPYICSCFDGINIGTPSKHNLPISRGCFLIILWVPGIFRDRLTDLSNVGSLYNQFHLHQRHSMWPLIYGLSSSLQLLELHIPRFCSPILWIPNFSFIPQTLRNWQDRMSMDFPLVKSWHQLGEDASRMWLSAIKYLLKNAP